LVTGSLHGGAGRRDEALKTIAELEGEDGGLRVSSVSQAGVRAGLGDKERALDMLDQSYAGRSDHLLVIGIAPDVESLRSEPRFVELLRRVGLTQ
jgi:hypothetical protein